MFGATTHISRMFLKCLRANGVVIRLLRNTVLCPQQINVLPSDTRCRDIKHDAANPRIIHRREVSSVFVKFLLKKMS